MRSFIKRFGLIGLGVLLLFVLVLLYLDATNRFESSQKTMRLNEVSKDQPSGVLTESFVKQDASGPSGPRQDGGAVPQVHELK